MGTVELKLSLHQLIDGVTDNAVLEAIHTLLSKTASNQKEDWYLSLSEEAKASIQRGIDDLNNGHTISNEEAMNRIHDKVSRLKNAK